MASEWIPVGERLPLHGSHVIACTLNPQNKPVVLEMKFYDWDEGDLPYFATEDGVDMYVTHWMPLPEPPEVK